MDRPSRRFLFRLAGHLNKTVGELERTMSAVEMLEWQALQAIDPLPDWWWGLAKLCATTINVNRSKGRPIKPEDVFPGILKQHTRQTDEQKARRIREWLS